MFKRRILGLTSYFRSAQESLLPDYDPASDFKIVELPMSDYQLKIYELARQGERNEKKNLAKKKNNIYDEVASTYKIFSRVFCNFVFPKEIERPMQNNKNINDVLSDKNKKIDEDDLDAKSVKEKLNNMDGRYTIDDKADLESSVSNDVKFKDRIKSSIIKLKDGVVDSETNKRKLFLVGEELKNLSPKFYNILNKLKSNDYNGLHLYYSQFRSLEGIGVFKAVLEVNGFAQFRIKKDKGNMWKLNIKKDDVAKPKFCLYTGEEGDEEKEIIRNVFNSNWNKVPISIKNELELISSNNYYGEIIKLIMITSSGAEGITLENVRYVHIFEPYWHPVRTEQVIGRAVRICSHKNLKKEDRNVKVFQYIMKITDEQINGNPKSKDPKKRNPQITNELKKHDKSKENPNEIFTTDQSLHEISNRKATINQNILNAIKSSSFDCALHKKPGQKENIPCYTFSSKNRQKFLSVPELSNEESDVITSINRPKQKWKGIKFNWRGKPMVLKKDHPEDKQSKTGDVYDYESYKDGILNNIGRLEINPKNPKKYMFIPI